MPTVYLQNQNGLQNWQTMSLEHINSQDSNRTVFSFHVNPYASGKYRCLATNYLANVTSEQTETIRSKGHHLVCSPNFNVLLMFRTKSQYSGIMKIKME